VRGVVGVVLVANRLLSSQADGSLMARRSVDVVDLTELMVHWHAGRSQSDMT